MSSTCNNGSITFLDADLDQIVKIWNESRFRIITGNVTDNDFYIFGHDATYEVQEIYGDISEELDDLVSRIGNAGIKMELSVSYYDSYGDGQFFLSDDGLHAEALDIGEAAIRLATTDELITELMRRNGSLIEGDYNKDHMKRGFLVPTQMGLLHAYPSYDPDYPGVLVDITPANQKSELGVAMIEVTETEADLDTRYPHLISRIWGDCEAEEYSDRVVHRIPDKEEA